jgi:hypothetical protein
MFRSSPAGDSLINKFAFKGVSEPRNKMKSRNVDSLWGRLATDLDSIVGKAWIRIGILLLKQHLWLQFMGYLNNDANP